MKYVDQLTTAEKRVLLRADFDYSVDDKPAAELLRLKKIIPTITHLLGQRARITILGHAPKSKNGEASLRPVAEKLAEVLQQNIKIVPLAEAKKSSSALNPGEIMLVDNLAGNKDEEKNDPAFARELARMGEVYINDAFSAADRKYASTVGIPQFISAKAAGLLIKKELEYFDRAIVNPKRPLCVVLGGANAGPRLDILKNLAPIADKLLVGGALANTFLAAQGLQMGRSIIERELYPRVLTLIGMLARRDSKAYFPVDFRIGDSPKSRGLVRNVTAQEVPPDSMILDIGPATSTLFAEALTNAETIVWNGPMGTFENEDYAQGTTDLIQSLGEAHGLKVAGGAATETAIRMMELEHKFDHISTGGTAFLTLLEGKALSALTALD